MWMRNAAVLSKKLLQCLVEQSMTVQRNVHQIHDRKLDARILLATNGNRCDHMDSDMSVTESREV